MIIMNPRFPNKNVGIFILLCLLIAIVGCKKSNDGPKIAEFETITFKFGSDSTAIAIDNAVQVLKNMPRSCDVTQLGASAVLPAGYSISPNPAIAVDYTKSVSYTITNKQGDTFSIKITAPAYDPVNNPYGIYTAAHLSNVRKGMNDSYVLMNDIQLPNQSAPNASAEVGISDYKDYGWYSIGATYVNGGHVMFRGSLDGNNHVIKNFTSSFRPSGNPLPTGIDAGHSVKTNDGLFGYAMKATIKNLGIQLAATGINDITPENESYSNVGSLVGLADSSSITNCFVTGSSVIKAGQYTGGLIGRARYSTISKSYVAIVPATGDFAIAAYGDGGGLIGSALVCEVSDSYASSSIVGNVNVGGLIGSTNTVNVKTSYASGRVQEMPNNIIGGFSPSNNLGGLIGSVTGISPANSTIVNSYATGAVAGVDGANVSFHRNTRIGGLVGSVASTTVPTSITNCYATGNLSRAKSNTVAPFWIGGLAGTTPNNVFVLSSASTNYWDKETTGQTSLGGGNATSAQDNAFTVNGKTSTEMKTMSTFANWDFSAVWTIGSGANNGYPYLRSNNR